MGEFATVDISGMESLAEKMSKYGAAATKEIQDYLKSDGFDRISAHIPGLIHASGRSWKGKAASATAASAKSVFQGTQSGLTLTVATKKRYNYLYFPDDGSNTKRHAGNQGFMQRGAEAASGTIADELVTRIVSLFEEE